MLGEGERQVLAHIESDLCREDPLLAVALLRMCPPQPGRRVRIAHDTVVALSLVESLICLALAHDGTGQACLLAAGLATVTRVLRVRRFPTQSRARRTRPPKRWL